MWFVGMAQVITGLCETLTPAHQMRDLNILYRELQYSSYKTERERERVSQVRGSQIDSLPVRQTVILRIYSLTIQKTRYKQSWLFCRGVKSYPEWVGMGAGFLSNQAEPTLSLP